MDAKTQYWVAPDGKKHPLNPDQLQHLMQSATIADSSSASPQQRHQAPVAAPPPGLGATKQTAGSTNGSTNGSPSAAAVTVAHNNDEHDLDDLDREMLRDAEISDSGNEEGSGSDESESDEDEDEDHHSAYHNHPQDPHYSKGDSKHVVEREIGDDAELDNDVAWIPRGVPPPAYSESDRLPVPVLIPQVHAGIKHPFSRAWAPILESRGVQKQEFLQFLDHLNVCKAASPPLRVLMLAGNIVGFTPVPFGFAVAAGTSAIAVGGMFAMARYRMGRYLKRVNEEYFFPRGLCATVAKQKNLSHLTGIPDNLPLLAPPQLLPGTRTGTVGTVPRLRDRRLQAMGQHVAAIQYEDSPRNREENILDRWTSRSSERQSRKSEKRTLKKSMKDQPKAIKREAKLERKVAKEKRKGDVEKVAKLERKLGRHQEIREEQGIMMNETSNSSKEEKLASKFLFVVVGQLTDEMRERLKKQAGK